MGAVLLDQAIQDKDAGIVKQFPSFKAHLITSGGAAKALDESVSITLEFTLEEKVPEIDSSAPGQEDSRERGLIPRAAEALENGESITSGSTLEKLIPELDDSAPGHEDSKEGRLRVVFGALGPLHGELNQEANGGQKSGNQKEGLCLQQFGPANAAEKEEVGGKEGPSRDKKATAVSPALSTDESNRKKLPDEDGHHGETKQMALPNTERIANEEGRSQARPRAHPVAGSQQREPPRVTSKEYIFSRLSRTTAPAPAVRATNPVDPPPDSELRQQFVNSTAPNVILLCPVKPPSSDGGRVSSSGGDEDDLVVTLDIAPPPEVRRDASSGRIARERESANSHPDTPLTTRAGGMTEPRHARIPAEVTATLENGRNEIRSATITPTGLRCSGPCDDKWKSGNKDLASIEWQSVMPTEVRKSSIVKDPWCVRILAEAAVTIASNSSKEKLTALPTGKSASRPTPPPITPPSVARDRWSVRVLVKTRATLASCGVLGRSADVSLETAYGLLPSVEDGNRRGNKVTGTERRASGGGGRCSASSSRKRRKSLPIMTQERRGKGGVAAATTVHRWTACGSASSELPTIVDVGSCLVGGSASKLVVSRGRTMCIRDDTRGSPGPVKITDDTPRRFQGSPQRWQRERNTRERENELVPTRPPGRAHPLNGKSACVSRASFAAGKTLAAGGPRCGGENVPVEFHGHIVVSPGSCRTAEGDGSDSGHGGFVSGGGGRHQSSPAPERRSTNSAVKAALRRSSCPWSGSSPNQLPTIVDTGSLELDDSASVWAVEKAGLLRQRDTNARLCTKGRPQYRCKGGVEVCGRLRSHVATKNNVG